MKEHSATVLKYCIMVFSNMKWGRTGMVPPDEPPARREG